MPPIGYLLIAILVVIIGIIVIRTWLFTRAAADNKLAFTSSLASFKADASSAAEHLASLIRFETISHEDPKENDAKIFKEQHKQLEKLYPKTHKALTKEVLDGFSLLYTWVGTDPSLDPIALMAHQDVVPADPNTMDKWTYPPFSGKIADGYIWGRGTLDIKSQMAAVFEAVEALITNNFQPERSVMLAFGHDEEVLGTGAKSIVAHLQAKGIRLQAVLDEGGCIYDGVIPGITGYTATIGVAEKGYLSMKFTAKASGGHSSTPPHETAIGILARAIDRLQSNPFPHKVRAVRPLFQGLSPSASLIMKVAFANLWLFGGMVKRQLASSTETDATIRTTTAPTIFHSGVKDNVLPGLAEAVVNFRVLPGETIAEVNDRIRNVS